MTTKTDGTAVAMEKDGVKFVMLPAGRFSFPKIRELQYGQDDVEKKHGKYNFNTIYDAAADLSALGALIKSAAKAKFGDKARAMFEAGKLKLPTKSGATMVNNDGERYDGYEEDSQVVAVNFYNPMEFLDQFKNRIKSDTEQAERTFYGGCYVQVAVTAHGYDQGGGKGVHLRCYALMKRAEGEMFGGGGVGDPDDVFADVEAVEAPAVDGASESEVEEW